jgi:hypothetical protein
VRRVHTAGIAIVTQWYEGCMPRRCRKAFRWWRGFPPNNTTHATQAIESLGTDWQT